MPRHRATVRTSQNLGRSVLSTILAPSQQRKTMAIISSRYRGPDQA